MANDIIDSGAGSVGGAVEMAAEFAERSCRLPAGGGNTGFVSLGMYSMRDVRRPSDGT